MSQRCRQTCSKHGIAQQSSLLACQGFTALHLAALGGHAKVVELLLSHRADVQAQNQEVSCNAQHTIPL